MRFPDVKTDRSTETAQALSKGSRSLFCVLIPILVCALSFARCLFVDWGAHGVSLKDIERGHLGVLVVGGHNKVVLGGRQRGWRIRWPAAQSMLRELRQRARSACSVPMEPGSWGLSMKVPCFMDGRGSGMSLSMESACFVDGRGGCGQTVEWGWVLLGNL